jgi:hypothetical protein
VTLPLIVVGPAFRLWTSRLRASKPNLWHAAIESKTCKFTLGEQYRRLVAANL